MLVIILFGLIAKSVLVSGACDVGTVKENTFDWNQFKNTGPWYWLLHNPNEYENGISCPETRFKAHDGKSNAVISKGYDISKQRELTFHSEVVNWTNNAYYEVFKTKSMWSGYNYILAIDYDRYFISKMCSEMSGEVFTYVAFRSRKPDLATMLDVFKDLQENNIDPNELELSPTNHC